MDGDGFKQSFRVVYVGDDNSRNRCLYIGCSFFSGSDNLQCDSHLHFINYVVN